MAPASTTGRINRSRRGRTATDARCDPATLRTHRDVCDARGVAERRAAIRGRRTPENWPCPGRAPRRTHRERAPLHQAVRQIRHALHVALPIGGASHRIETGLATHVASINGQQAEHRTGDPVADAEPFAKNSIDPASNRTPATTRLTEDDSTGRTVLSHVSTDSVVVRDRACARRIVGKHVGPVFALDGGLPTRKTLQRASSLGKYQPPPCLFQRRHDEYMC
jgi:hypothetical protein